MMLVDRADCCSFQVRRFPLLVLRLRIQLRRRRGAMKLRLPILLVSLGQGGGSSPLCGALFIVVLALLLFRTFGLSNLEGEEYVRVNLMGIPIVSIAGRGGGGGGGDGASPNTPSLKEVETVRSSLFPLGDSVFGDMTTSLARTRNCIGNGHVSDAEGGSRRFLSSAELLLLIGEELLTDEMLSMTDDFAPSCGSALGDPLESSVATGKEEFVSELCLTCASAAAIFSWWSDGITGFAMRRLCPRRGGGGCSGSSS
jgi:hypothetical protein